MSPTSFRPTPSFVLSMLALTLAMGGVAWAATKIGTADIQNGAITKKKLAKGAVGTKQLADEAVKGSKVKESSLGEVPSAARSINADNADRVGELQVQKFSTRPSPGSGPATVATVGTLQLRAGCSGGGQPLFTVTAAGGAAAQTVRTSVVKGNGTVGALGEGTLPGGGIAVLDGGDIDFSYNGTVDALTQGGEVTTVQWSARSTSFVPSPNPDGNVCLFWGTAISG